MSRRTCANRSGSLAGGLAESNRIFCHTTRFSTAPYLNPVTLLYFFPFHLPPPLFFFIFYSLLGRHTPALRFLLTPPSTHALILNPLDNSRSCSCPSPYPIHLSPLTPLRDMSTKGRSTPRVVCCAIPIARAAGKVLVITSRKRPNHWVCESLSIARSTSASLLIHPSF